MRYAVILAAIIIKSYLWFRLMPRFVGYAVLAAAVALALVMFSVLMQRNEASHQPTEIYCNNPFADQPVMGFECQFKLRSASLQLFMR